MLGFASQHAPLAPAPFERFESYPCKVNVAVKLSHEEAEKLLKSLTLPPWPKVLTELKAAQQRHCDLATLAAIVGKDLSLAAAVLKVANSPSFAGRTLSSLSDAVFYLGAANLESVVIGVTLKQAVPLPPILRTFWDESGQIAEIASQLAGRLRRDKREQAYLFCLFRDCGIPVLVQRFPSYIATLARAMAQPEKFTEIELKSRNTSHVIVGYLLARSWFMPELLSDAILHHHDWDLLGENPEIAADSAWLVAVARLAEHILRTQVQDDPDSTWQQWKQPVLNQLNLTASELSDLIVDCI